LSGQKFDEFCNALSDFGVTVRESEQFNVSEEATCALTDLLEEEYTIPQQHLKAKLGVSSTFKDLTSDRVHLPFAVRYQLEACLSNNLIKMSSLTHEFLEKLREMDSYEAVNILEKVVDKQHVYYDPTAIFNTSSKVLRQRSIPRHCVMQRSVNITPTMMHVASPVLEISNRIIRQHSANADRFIRVKFSDEKGEGALRNLPGGRADALFDRVHRAMKNGIVVAGRYYQFLAFGNSQFREHGAYFYAPTPTQSAEDIRKTLGQFEHIRTVAKYGARLGQCFSTTRAMQTTVAIKTIADIERNGYTFTDGVGKLSLFLAQMAAQDLGLHNAFIDPPSLFQFRLGGCKGVLALDRTITKNEVHIRPSQFKFEAPYTGLEIIRCSSLATPFFNRQIIIVLSNLGVPDDVFIRRQQAMMRSYELAMTDRTEALNCLLKHIDINQSTLMMASMVKDGFLDVREPFVMSLLGLWRARTIKELKKKARIAIDEGAFVLGCVDESGILQGHRDEPQSRLDATRDEKMNSLPETFIQIDDTSNKGHYKIIEGLCVLARNPSLHPGDIRVVRAVNVPALQHHKNVVVLPQTGDRDLANMCSGGDLDGDDFMVLWAEDLVPETINYPPMDFTPDKPTDEDDPIDISKVCNFFVTYMKNESLGQIAHAHLAQADQCGVFSETCISLARLHSQAVDYPKSGIEAAMSPNLRPRKWPHFMEKKHKPASQIYKSKNILGLLYDQVQLVGFNPSWTHEFDHRILDNFDNDESLLGAAAKIKANYDDDMRRLMAKHGIQTEFEAFSVFVLEHNHETRDYKFAEEFGRTIGILKAQYREACLLASGATSVMDWDKLGPFVAAMYTVTAEEVRSAVEQCNVHAREPKAENMPFMSFPWLFHTQLGKLATDGTLKPDVEMASAHHQRKQRKNNMEDTGNLGTLQTDEGILHFGDMLDLKFGDI
jgi:RNA-dependent RNA polymerase